MGSPLALLVLFVVLVMLVGLVLVIRGLFFGAKETAQGVDEHAEDVGNDGKPGFFG
jgi:hypothetical protein